MHGQLHGAGHASRTSKLRSVGQQLEVSDVHGTDDTEVASVECRELRFPQTFDAGQDGGIDEPQRKVAVLRD